VGHSDTYSSPPSRKKRLRDERVNTGLFTRIDKILANSAALTAWENTFLLSVREGASRYGSLTAKQESIIQRIENNHNPEAIAARKSWNDNFSQEMRDKMKIAARYYLNNPPYFADLAGRVLHDDVFIPTEKQYRAMVENKYVAKVIDNMNSDPIFLVGTMARVRTVATGHKMRYHRDKMVMIIDYPNKIPGAAKGAIPVIVLPIGSSETIETEVRWLKKARI